MSALGPPLGTQDRARRGYRRIEQSLHELERLANEVGCIACWREIEQQIARQKDSLVEIERVWGKIG